MDKFIDKIFDPIEAWLDRRMDSRFGPYYACGFYLLMTIVTGRIAHSLGPADVGTALILGIFWPVTWIVALVVVGMFVVGKILIFLITF